MQYELTNNEDKIISFDFYSRKQTHNNLIDFIMFASNNNGRVINFHYNFTKGKQHLSERFKNNLNLPLIVDILNFSIKQQIELKAVFSER